MKKNVETRDEIFAEEGFIADVQFAIHNLLEDKKMTRADLARALDISQARVSQMFGDAAKNLTLRTLARIFHALGEDIRVTSPRLEEILYSHDTTQALAKAKWSDDRIIELIAFDREARPSFGGFQFESNDNHSAEDALAA